MARKSEHKNRAFHGRKEAKTAKKSERVKVAVYLGITLILAIGLLAAYNVFSNSQFGGNGYFSSLPPAASATSGAPNPLPNTIAVATVSLTNSQPIATGPNFQQMIVFNQASNNYQAEESNDLGNIRFYQSNVELYSWCESGC